MGEGKGGDRRLGKGKRGDEGRAKGEGKRREGVDALPLQILGSAPALTHQPPSH